jgi:hypothetical protein
MAETKIYKFDIVILKSDIDKYEPLFNALDSQASSGARHDFAGICLAPGTDTTGNTTEIKIALVGLNESGSTQASLTIYTNNEVDSFLRGLPSTDSMATNPPALTFPTSTDTVPGASLLFDYNRTREFEYVFLDKETLDYLTTSNFYNSPPAPNTRGIQLTRALVIFNSEIDRFPQAYFSNNESGMYRTVRLSPSPPAQLSLDSNTRASVAYSIPPTCPPFWRNATGGSRFMSVAPNNSSRQFPQDPNAEASPIYRINRNELSERLQEQNFVSKEAPPVYKAARWPIILIGAVLLLAVGYSSYNLIKSAF